MLKLYVISDLHLEFTKWTPDPEAVAAADIIVLAGDIGIGTHGVAWAALTFPDKPVFYVIGNHEFYGGNISRTAIDIKAVAHGTNVIVLDNDEYHLQPGVTGGEPVRVLGATLWTDFKLFGNELATYGNALRQAGHFISDFSCITFGTTGWMTPAQSVILHEASVKYLRAKLAEPFDGTTVVVTHHLPSFNAVAPQYQKDILSAAFASNLDDLVCQADLWIAGHTHVCFDTVGKQGGRIVVNPRGYVRGDEQENPAFNPSLVVEV